MIVEKPNIGKPHIPKTLTKSSKMEDGAYKDMLIDVAECIDDRTLERIKFKCSGEIKTRESEEIKTPLQLFIALEKRELLGAHHTEFLKELLKTCGAGKLDGLRLIESYETRLHNGINTAHTQPAAQVIYVSTANIPRQLPQQTTQTTGE